MFLQQLNQSFSWRDPMFQEIKQRHLDMTTAVALPSANLITGQPGAGKSTIVRKQSKFLTNAVTINVDNLKLYYPGYKEKQIVSPFLRNLEAVHAARIWAVRLFAEAAINRRNIVMETVSSSGIASVISCMFWTLKTRGYYNHVHALAVNARCSTASIFQRLEQSERMEGFGRWVAFSKHNHCYLYLTKEIGSRLWSHAFEEISICKRDGTTVYQGADPAVAVQALVLERNRPWTDDEIGTHTKLVETVRAAAEQKATQRPGWYLAAVEELASQARQIEDRKYQPQSMLGRDMTALKDIMQAAYLTPREPNM